MKNSLTFITVEDFANLVVSKNGNDTAIPSKIGEVSELIQENADWGDGVGTLYTVAGLWNEVADLMDVVEIDRSDITFTEDQLSTLVLLA